MSRVNRLEVIIPNVDNHHWMRIVRLLASFHSVNKIILDDHDVARFVAGVEGSGFAGDDETLDAETAKHAHRKRALHEGVAFALF